MIKFFKNIYYSIWSDAINYERIKNGGETHWQIFTFAYMSILLSLNVLALLSAFLYFSKKNIFSEFILDLKINGINDRLINIIWYLLFLFIPSFLFTYFSVFYNKKYKYILENYKFKKGKLLLIYFCITIFAFFCFSLLNKYK